LIGIGLILPPPEDPTTVIGFCGFWDGFGVGLIRAEEETDDPVVVARRRGGAEPLGSELEREEKVSGWKVLLLLRRDDADE